MCLQQPGTSSSGQTTTVEVHDGASESGATQASQEPAPSAQDSDWIPPASLLGQSQGPSEWPPTIVLRGLPSPLSLWTSRPRRRSAGGRRRRRRQRRNRPRGGCSGSVVARGRSRRSRRYRLRSVDALAAGAQDEMALWGQLEDQRVDVGLDEFGSSRGRRRRR